MIQIMKLFVHTIIKILIMKTIVLVNKSGRLYQFFWIRNTKVDALRKMKEPLRRKAMLFEALGLSTEKVKIIYNDELKTVLKYDSNKICIYDDGCLDIQFDPPF